MDFEQALAHMKAGGIARLDKWEHKIKDGEFICRHDHDSEWITGGMSNNNILSEDWICDPIPRKKVKKYLSRLYNSSTEQWIRINVYNTREDIETSGYIIIEDTMIEVDE